MQGPIETYGYDAVGPGWLCILKALDASFVELIEESGLKKPVKVGQIKEKFGGLRVYLNHVELPRDLANAMYKEVSLAEGVSLKTCEECGCREKTNTRSQKAKRSTGWIKTLCNLCHKKRDSGKKVGTVNKSRMGR